MRPVWLNKKIDLAACSRLKGQLKMLRVNTVCEEALCPNIGECFSKNLATFLILGRNCTRACSFCNVEKKKQPGKLDWQEPSRIAKAVEKMHLSHAVITSVTRDDLPDGGAKVYVKTVLAIKKITPLVTVELLIPDFGFSLKALESVANSGAEIIGHNIETVPSLYRLVRRGSDYARSLCLLRNLKRMSRAAYKVKSGLMLGLGEKEGEVVAVMQDLRSAGCDFLSIGQYLSPSKIHYPVKEYILPEKFLYLKEKAMLLGFLHVESSPYTRSSYMASEYKEN